MIGAEQKPQARAVLSLLYRVGLRASEAAALRHKDLSPRGRSGGQAAVLGKGDKVRVVLLPPAIWRELSELGVPGQPDAPVVSKGTGRPLDRWDIHRIVKRAAKRVGLSGAISAHWLRHSHASHALDHGAPLHAVQKSLGHASVATTSIYLHVRPGDSSAKYLPE